MLSKLRDFVRVRPKGRYTRWAGLATFFSFSFFLFAYWSFPYERLRDYIVQEVEYPTGPDGERRPSGYELEIVDLRPSWFTGVELRGIRLAKPPETPDERSVDLTIERLKARVGLFALLLGTKSVGFEAFLADGRVEGAFSRSPDATSFELGIDTLDLRRLTLLRGMLGLPIAGIASGDIELTLTEENETTAGRIELDVQDMQIGDDQAKLQLEGMGEGLTVDRMAVGNLRVRIGVEDGIAHIEELKARGSDAELDGSGSIRLFRPLKKSRLDILLRVKFHEDYQNKSERTRALFSLMDLNPKLRAAKTPDGGLQWRIRGAFGSRISTVAAGRAPMPEAP